MSWQLNKRGPKPHWCGRYNGCGYWRREPQPQPPLSHSPWYLLTKLGKDDDVEAYLEAFECMVGMACWSKDQWVFFLGPYMLGEIFTILKALEKPDTADYAKLKSTILDCYEITPDSYQ